MLLKQANHTETPVIHQDDQARGSATIASMGEVLHHPYLDTINIVVDPDLHILCCHICQVALPPDHVSGHIKNAHPAIKLDVDQYCQAVEDMQIAPALPISITGDRHLSAYKGLKIHDGFACNLCSYVGGSTRTMANHHRAEHDTIPTPKHWSCCKMQQLNKGAGKRFWRIAGGEKIDCDHQRAIDAMRQEMSEVTRVDQVPQENRMVSPWLLTTEWHKHVIGHEAAALRKLVEIPQDTHPIMPGIATAVEQYFKSASILLDTTDELILQRLNTPEPSKG